MGGGDPDAAPAAEDPWAPRDAPDDLAHVEAPDWLELAKLLLVGTRFVWSWALPGPAATETDAARPTRTPTKKQLAEIDKYIRKGQYQKAIDKTIQYYGIDTSNIKGKVTYDPKTEGAGSTDRDRNLRIGPGLFETNVPDQLRADMGPASLAATLLHEVTHANQIKSHGWPGDLPRDQTSEEFRRSHQNWMAYEAMGYQAALEQADQLGLTPEQKQWYADMVDLHKSSLSDENRLAFEAGRYWDMEPKPP